MRARRRAGANTLTKEMINRLKWPLLASKMILMLTWVLLYGCLFVGFQGAGELVDQGQSKQAIQHVLEPVGRVMPYPYIYFYTRFVVAWLFHRWHVSRYGNDDTQLLSERYRWLYFYLGMKERPDREGYTKLAMFVLIGSMLFPMFVLVSEPWTEQFSYVLVMIPFSAQVFALAISVTAAPVLVLSWLWKSRSRINCRSLLSLRAVLLALWLVLLALTASLLILWLRATGQSATAPVYEAVCMLVGVATLAVVALLVAFITTRPWRYAIIALGTTKEALPFVLWLSGCSWSTILLPYQATFGLVAVVLFCRAFASRASEDLDGLRMKNIESVWDRESLNSRQRLDLERLRDGEELSRLLPLYEMLLDEAKWVYRTEYLPAHPIEPQPITSLAQAHKALFGPHKPSGLGVDDVDDQADLRRQRLATLRSWFW